MMSLWDALRMNMMISYQELVRTFHKPSPKSAAVEYPQRQLLGFTDDDRQLVESIIIDYITD
ncbi:phage virion morphogenesis protein [Klebsiella pneumoniae]